MGYDCFAGTGVKRIIFNGQLEKINAFRTTQCENLEQLVFLDAPPVQNGIDDDTGSIGFVNGNQLTTVFYLNANSALWAPNGETEWCGFPLIGIDSLDDLPPL